MSAIATIDTLRFPTAVASVVEPPVRKHGQTHRLWIAARRAHAGNQSSYTMTGETA